MPVPITITGDAAQAQKAIDGLHSQIAKLQTQNKQLATESKQGTSDWASAVDQVKSRFADLVTPMTLAVGTTAALIRGSQEWNEKLKSIGGEILKNEQALIKMAADRGLLPYLDQIVERFNKIGASKEESIAAFTGVSGAAPRMPGETQDAALNRQMEMTEVALRARNSGIDLNRYGGQLGKASQLMPSQSPEARASVVSAMREDLSDKEAIINSPRFLKMVEIDIADGETPERAFAKGVTLALHSQRGSDPEAMFGDGESKIVNGRIVKGSPKIPEQWRKEMELRAANYVDREKNIKLVGDDLDKSGPGRGAILDDMSDDDLRRIKAEHAFDAKFRVRALKEIERQHLDSMGRSGPFGRGWEQLGYDIDSRFPDVQAARQKTMLRIAREYPEQFDVAPDSRNTMVRGNSWMALWGDSGAIHDKTAAEFYLRNAAELARSQGDAKGLNRIEAVLVKMEGHLGSINGKTGATTPDPNRHVEGR